MKNKMMLLAAALLWCTISFAQYNGQSDLESAANFYSEYGKNKAIVSNLDSAKKYIERSFKDEGISNNATANNYYGAIMKEIYKVRESADMNSPARKKAVDLFMKSIQLDSSAKNKEIVKQQVNWIAGQFNNDAKRALETNADVETAGRNFSEFKKLKLFVDPSYNIKAKEIEFQLAMGSALQVKADETKKKDYFDLAKVAYFKVLDIDSTNNDANYNIGIIYYNQGAHIIMKVMDWDTPIDSIPYYEDWAQKLFKQAKPFMHKASAARPNCLKVLEGLMGIYYSLNDDENFKKYKALYEKLKADIEAGRIKEEC